MLLGVSPCINLLKNPPPLGVGSVKDNLEKEIHGIFEHAKEESVDDCQKIVRELSEAQRE